MNNNRTTDQILADIRHAYPDEARRLAALAQEVTMRDLEILLLRRRLLELAPLERRRQGRSLVRELVQPRPERETVALAGERAADSVDAAIGEVPIARGV